MGSVKSQVLLLFDFLTGAKTWGGVGYKVNVMKLKFYWVSEQEITDGITGDRPEIADFNCIDNLERW